MCPVLGEVLSQVLLECASDRDARSTKKFDALTCPVGPYKDPNVATI